MYARVRQTRAGVIHPLCMPRRNVSLQSFSRRDGTRQGGGRNGCIYPCRRGAWIRKLVSHGKYLAIRYKTRDTTEDAIVRHESFILKVICKSSFEFQLDMDTKWYDVSILATWKTRLISLSNETRHVMGRTKKVEQMLLHWFIEENVWRNTSNDIKAFVMLSACFNIMFYVMYAYGCNIRSKNVI